MIGPPHSPYFTLPSRLLPNLILQFQFSFNFFIHLCFVSPSLEYLLLLPIPLLCIKSFWLFDWSTDINSLKANIHIQEKTHNICLLEVLVEFSGCIQMAVHTSNVKCSHLRIRENVQCLSFGFLAEFLGFMPNNV